MKTQTELNELKQEFESLTSKLQELSEDELKEITGGATLHPDNMAAGPASYGMDDNMGRMHSDAQFA